MTLRIGLLAAALLVLPALAESANWTDPYFGKSWELTPQGEDVLLLFEPGISPAERAQIETGESLSLIHAYNETYGTAVYHLETPEDVVGRLAQHASCRRVVRGEGCSCLLRCRRPHD